MLKLSIEKRLEIYTIKHPQEVLIVRAMVEKEEEIITIYKGFSSSLTRATAFDPDAPILADSAEIISIDRVASPYLAENPRYLQRGLNLEEMEKLLQESGISSS